MWNGKVAKKKDQSSIQSDCSQNWPNFLTSLLLEMRIDRKDRTGIILHITTFTIDLKLLILRELEKTYEIIYNVNGNYTKVEKDVKYTNLSFRLSMP